MRPAPSSPGSAGQDGSYLAERLLDEGVRGARAQPLQRAVPHCPGVDLHRGDLTDVDRGPRACWSGSRPDEIYNLAAVELGRPLLAAAGSHRPGQRRWPPSALLESAPAGPGDDRPARCGSSRRPAPRSSGSRRPSPQDEETPLRPVNPYGAAKAYAHLMTGVYRRRGLHAVSAILYNHESPRRPAQFVTRKITAAPRRSPAARRGRRRRLGQPGRPAGLGLGTRLRGRDGPGRSRGERRTMSSAPASGRSVRDFVAAALGHVGISDWERHVRVDPTFVRPADPSDLTADATQARSARLASDRELRGDRGADGRGRSERGLTAPSRCRPR